MSSEILQPRQTGGPLRSRIALSPAQTLVVAAVIFLTGLLSPPSLMDDVDAVQAQIARNMLQSGDWVTARLDGIPYLEKAPLKYWLIAASYAVFGVHDWSARLPGALGAIALCLMALRFGSWALGERAGVCAGLMLATSVGLWLFTRILIPDVLLTLAITTALWAFLRALDDQERRPNVWAATLGASVGVGFLLKGMIAVVFPCATGLLFLAVTRKLGLRQACRRLQLWRSLLVASIIALPWVAMATVRNPPYFDLAMRSEPGKWHGFFWFFFFNEHLFRFLNLRYPRDYNTVPRWAFWLYHLLWLFPWSAYLPAAARLSYRPMDRAGRARLLCLCWIGVVLLFFTFSTTQEYYSMPAYPALALLLGAAVASGDPQRNKLLLWGTRTAAAVALAGGFACLGLLTFVWGFPTPGDIAGALRYHYTTLALGRAQDLTLAAFAYLRLPLAVASVALLLGASGALWRRGRFAIASLALMMVLFFQAARLALITFDPYLSSRRLAEALKRLPTGTLIVDDQYYAFSSVFFYADVSRAFLLNGRVTNLEYGSYAPGAPDVFLTDSSLPAMWQRRERCYLIAVGTARPRFERLLGLGAIHVVSDSGGKLLLTNRDRKEDWP